MSLLTGFSFFIVIINLPLQFQVVNGDTPIMAGVHLIPLLLAAALGALETSFVDEKCLQNVGSALGGVLFSKKNLTSYCLIISAFLMLLGCGLLSTMPSSQFISPSQYSYQFILGLGIGLSFSSLTFIATFSNAHDTVGKWATYSVNLG
jgi:hypothetical protein